MHNTRLSILLSSTLVACATTEGPGPYYEGPTSSTSCSVSEVAGTRNENRFPVADHTVFVASIDSLSVRQAESRFAMPQSICSGTHKLTIAWSNGSGKADYAQLFLEAQVGRSYLIRHKVADKNLVRVWVEDKATSSQVGEAVFVQLVPTPSSNIVPVFIPRK